MSYRKPKKKIVSQKQGAILINMDKYTGIETWNAMMDEIKAFSGITELFIISDQGKNGNHSKLNV